MSFCNGWDEHSATRPNGVTRGFPTHENRVATLRAGDEGEERGLDWVPFSFWLD